MNLDALRDAVAGTVSTPDDADYGAATATWDLSAGSHPPVALRAAAVGDIAAGARWAAANDLRIAVRSTGHGARSDDHDALVINTAALDRVTVDPVTRRAVAEPGARWSDVAAAAAPLGLSGLVGGSPGVGVVGYTLGGGLGPIGRTFGFAADRVRRIDALDADYRPITIDGSDPDAFWALRGAGGLALVTGIEFELVPLAELFGGGVYFDAADAAEILAAYAAWIEDLDERTTTSIALLRLPPIPELPDALRGRRVVHLRIAHVDPAATDVAADGARILTRMLRAGRVIVDYARRMSAADLPDIHRDPVLPQTPAYRGALLDALDGATRSGILQAFGSGDTGPTLIEVRHLGGAYARQPEHPDCVTGRTSSFNLYVSAVLDPADPVPAHALVDAAVAAITPSTRAQFNFAGPAPAPGEVCGLWSDADAQRILAVQRSLDPANRIWTGRPWRGASSS